MLTTAIEEINNRIGPVQKKSAVYETESWGVTGDPDYLNQVIFLKTELPAVTVLSEILAIETELGRMRYKKWASRLIDIDILFYNNEIINEPGLQVPHPQLHHRRFTLEPLTEIAPEFIHPAFNKTLAELKKELNDSLIVKKL